MRNNRSRAGHIRHDRLGIITDETIARGRHIRHDRVGMITDETIVGGNM